MQIDNSKLYYARNRYYNPQQGRFISEDPAGFMGGFNAYMYCGGDPINFTDPLGLWANGSYGADVWAVFKGYGQALYNTLQGMAMMSSPEGQFQMGMIIGGRVYACGAGKTLRDIGDGIDHDFTDWMTTGDPNRFGQSFGNVLIAAAGEAAPYADGVSIFKGGCFTGDTLVLMADGSSKPIADIVPGDQVLSKSDVNGTIEAKTVLDVSDRQVSTTIDVTLSDGTTLHTTDEHPFYVDGKGWVKAGQLAQGSNIVTRVGPRTTNANEGNVRVVRTAKIEGNTHVHNLLIQDSHTYFVASGNGSKGDKAGWKWVHDGCTLQPRSFRHILPRRFPGGSQTAGKSVFNAGENLADLATTADSVTRVPSPLVPGNYERVVNAGRMVGTDRTTGSLTPIYTVVTDGADNIITMHPGLPARPSGWSPWGTSSPFPWGATSPLF